MGRLNVTIDGNRVSAQEGTTILKAAKDIGVEIPTLCYAEGLSVSGNCRLCVVEVVGMNRLVASCHTPVEDGMAIYTKSEKVLRARRAVIELLLAGHTGPCVTDKLAAKCELHLLASEMETGPPRFEIKMPRFYPAEEVSPYVRRDLSKCILCGRCIRACREIAGVGLYSMAYRSFDSKVVVGCDGVLDDEVCKDCGICVDYCPTSALSWVGGGRKDSGKKALLDSGDPDKARNRDMLLNLLQETQRRDQYLSEVAIKGIADQMQLSVSDVYGVATFYAFLSVKPQGRNVIRVCKNLPCYLKGGAMIAASVEKAIGIGPGKTTDDGRFSFELTNCIGACDLAPAMLINDDVHGNLTPEIIPEILKAYT